MGWGQQTGVHSGRRKVVGKRKREREKNFNSDFSVLEVDDCLWMIMFNFIFQKKQKMGTFLVQKKLSKEAVPVAWLPKILPCSQRHYYLGR